MDGCVHIAACARIHSVDLDLLKCSARGISVGHQTLPSTSNLHGRCKATAATDDAAWNCIECGTGLSPWICLSCGLVHCGRYVNQDGLRHFNRHPSHAVCMDVCSFALFCYICDDNVVGSEFVERQLGSLRESLAAISLLRQSDHSYCELSGAGGVSTALKGGHEPPPKLQAQSATLRHYKGPGSIVRPRKPQIISGGALRLSSAVKPSPKRKRPVRPDKEDKADPKAKRLQAEEVVLGIRGLRNLGNTCFMNAVLQSLNNISDFARDLKRLPEKAFPSVASSLSVVRTRRSIPDQVYLASELRKTLWALEEAGSGAISPDALFSVVWKLVPRFRGFQQQDAHEFLRCILERLGTELGMLGKSQGSEGDSLVSGLFQGLLTSRVTCRACRGSSWKLDPFLDLSLDLPLGSNGKATASVEECLGRFFAPEDLEGREKARCEACGAKTPTTKQFYLRRLPNVLCLHLKRFRWQSGRQKLDQFVQFPVQGPGLDLKAHLLPPTLAGDAESVPTDADYHLAAVVVHHGSGAGSGHYTAYGQRKGEEGDGTWYHFNDSSVRRSSAEIVQQQKAYLLFYVRNKGSSCST